MARSKTNPEVDAYIRQADQWREETEKLRSILLDCGLTEELKWSKPCYAFEGGNIAVIQGFKKYCALLFFKGVLLKDPKKILVKTGENTVVGRQIRFTDAGQITKMAAVLKSYLQQAIAVEKSGLKVEVEKEPVSIPAELQSKFKALPALKTAFEALTPGRQRAYIFYFSGAKQSQTRTSRIEKCLPRILEGRGLLDQ